MMHRHIVYDTVPSKGQLVVATQGISRAAPGVCSARHGRAGLISTFWSCECVCASACVHMCTPTCVCGGMFLCACGLVYQMYMHTVKLLAFWLYVCVCLCRCACTGVSAHASLCVSSHLTR